ncbi:hypothetical protein [Shinella sp. JR1-6]|uniref:DUF4376 domain-containing protein n=1 Tax=Shinella sp. JR1-6 TaxID=2527671 RepID=UPI001A9F203B|nr:hypothetical protein [Shinella sp. JR1-6]
MLYTRNGSWPAPVPYAITLASGFIRTDPESFTAGEIADAGFVAAPDAPAYEPATEHLGWDGAAWTVTALPPPTGDDVNAERDRRIEAGATFVVAGYGPVPLQGRLKDQINLQSRLIAAQGAKAAGITDPILLLRDAADVNHMLTADQMIELVTKGVAWIEAVMQVSWNMKDGVAPFEAGIPPDYAENTYWPQPAT